MIKIFTYISTIRKILKSTQWQTLFIIFWCLFGLTACKLPNFITEKISKLPPQVIEKLAHIPYLGQYLVPQIAPKDLLQKANLEIEKAIWSGAEIYAPNLLNEARTNFQKGKQYLLKKKFIWSKYFLNKAIEKAKTARLESEKIRKQKQTTRYNKLEKLKKELLTSQNKTNFTNSTLLLKIKKLKLLIDEEKFEEFDKEYSLLYKEINSRGGQKPPIKTKSRLQ